MSDTIRISAENMLRALPSVLQNDEDMLALATAIAEPLEACMDDTDLPRIFPRISELGEELLDILAHDFKVDWWNYDYSISEKRATLESSWYVHKHMGTPSAIKTAIAAVYPDCGLKEWFEYGGTPYHFKISIPIEEDSIDMEKHEKVLSLIQFYKNVRSVLESISYNGATMETALYALAGYVGSHGTGASTVTFTDEEIGLTGVLCNEDGLILVDADGGILSYNE